MFSFENLTIRNKLIALSLLASASALVLARAAFFTYDIWKFRTSLVRNLEAQADIVGLNSASALLFHDTASGVSTLSALGARSSIQMAGLYSLEGNEFAVWNRDKSGRTRLPSLVSDPNEIHRYREGLLEVFHPIVFDGGRVGTVYIQANLDELRSRLVTETLITLGVLVLSILLATLVSVNLSNRISQPLLELATVAKTVSTERDFSVRVRVKSQDEIGLLISTFNDMLDDIQTARAELQKSHDELEQRVKDRTFQLEAANKELEAFSYSVSHDLRAPLRTVDGFSKALIEDCGDKLDNVGQRHVQKIREGSQQMAQLIDDMLNLSRVTRSPMNRENVDLSALSQSISNELRAAQPNRKLVFEIAENLVVQGDFRLLKIVMENLLSNAWKFTSKKPEAKIAVGQVIQGDGQTVFFVRDDGAGFDMAYADKLFGAFQRLHTMGEFAGTGVGLATVQRIINRHGGRIWAEGHVDQGATFYFSL